MIKSMRTKPTSEKEKTEDDRQDLSVSSPVEKGYLKKKRRGGEGPDGCGQ